MRIDEGLLVFGYNTANELDKADLNKRYRQLMRKYHPDLVYGNIELANINQEKSKVINEAYAYLKRAIDKLQELQDITNLANTGQISTIIPFDSLFSIYSGDGYKITYNNSEIFIDVSTLNSNKIMVDINCDILCNGYKQTFTNISLVSMSGMYEIECDIPLATDEELTISAYGKSMTFMMDTDSIRLRLKYPYNIILTILINKTHIDE